MVICRKDNVRDGTKKYEKKVWAMRDSMKSVKKDTKDVQKSTNNVEKNM